MTVRLYHVMATPFEMYELDGHQVKLSNPLKQILGTKTKQEIVEYFLSVAPGVLNAVFDRPTSLHRFPDGLDGEEFWQKRVPKGAAEWLKTATVKFPSGREAEMLCITDTASLVWALNLGCFELNCWPARRDDTETPDELRVDLDPTDEFSFEDTKPVAVCLRELLDEYGLRGFPKTSGKRGLHVYVRIERKWSFTEVRRAALALAREVERRLPDVATTAWWKENRRGVFLDYNQNARDRTIATAYSVRPAVHAPVSCPITFDELPDAVPEDLTMATVSERFKKLGDPMAELDNNPGSLLGLLELAARDEAGGLSDAPWPPHFPKQKGEPKRVQPSRAKGD